MSYKKKLNKKRELFMDVWLEAGKLVGQTLETLAHGRRFGQ